MSEQETADITGMENGAYLHHITRERHPSVHDIARWFAYAHLPEGLPRHVSASCANLAADMLEELPDSPELTTGLRKLLEAKDCFVRAAVAASEAEHGEPAR